jgi:hypothetical protein
MLKIDVDVNRQLIVLEPDGPLREEDFVRLAGVVDPFLEAQVPLDGIMVRTRDFPGWDSFGALAGHIRFVRDHHRQIGKVALVTDSPIGHLMPRLANHFVSAEIRHFPYAEETAARDWLTA